MKRLCVRHLGPLEHGKVQFGDLFQPDGHVRDISKLDPGDPDMAVAGWGGLTEFSANVSEIVGRVVARSAGDGA